MIWIQLFNFVLLVGVIAWFSRRKLNQYFENKKNDLQKDLAEAAHELKQIEAEYEEVSKKLSTIQAEVDEIKASAKKELAEEKSRIETETEEFIKKSFRDNNARMEQATNRARRTFKQELIETSLGSARDELIGRKAEQDQSWTVDVLEKSSEEESLKVYGS